MLFAVIGFFKPGIDTSPVKLQRSVNEHLGQIGLHLRLAGPLRDRGGKHTGFMVCLEAETFAAAEAYLGQSPYFEAKMYERVEVVEYTLEVGAGQLR